MTIPTRPAVPRRRPMLAVLLTGQLMASMDGSIASVAAQSIRTGLGTGGTAIQLIVSGYLLATGVLLVTCARIGDVVGHRRAFLLGLGCFTGASLLCGLAPDAATLVLARVAQGAGAALLIPQVLSLIQLTWDGTARRRALGLYGMVLALGVALGQVVGGLVVGADLFGLGWRPVFLLNVPVGAVLLALGPRLLPASPAVGRARLDLVGVAILSVAMTALIVPLVFGPDHGFPAWSWISLAGGAAGLSAFVRHEAGARHPLLDLAALRPEGVKPGLAACWLGMGCYTVLLLTLTLHLQSALGFSPLRAGLAFVPYTIGFGLVSLTWDRYPRPVRDALPVAGPIMLGSGAVALALLDRGQWHLYASVPPLVLAGAGHAAGYSPLIARIASLVEPRLASAVSALNATGPTLAGVVAVAGLGGVYFAAPTSADGLLRTAAAVAALLALAAGCAARAAYGARGAPPTPNPHAAPPRDAPPAAPETDSRAT
ncbi:MFS transporter [Actinomadura sp. WMMB 499]|uniref:MFS transporter n=1 Tax=Actinomadura sp. WMMB 499 TaxID=1219491 RepID=UPI0012466434|nr:MFS transporter [Actinomadura sp. WMMB 499]QFG25531.1 MFS transporter [Actinomadura sp. WMMB 499]